MPKQLVSKPCRRCGQPVDKIRRSDRKAFYYPRHCLACQRPPLTEEQKQAKRDLLNANRIVRQIGTSRLHNTGSTIYRVIKIDNTRRWKYEHRIVAEQMLGRTLEPGEIVHHINHDTLDNRPENLRVMTAGEHTILHMSITSWSAGGGKIVGDRTIAGAGTQNAGLVFGAYFNSTICTEEYNGTSWSVGGALNGARNATVGAGTQNEALAIGGSTCTEEYNGTSWSVGRTLTTGRTGAAGAGTQSAGLAAGGGSFTCTEEYTKQLTLVSKCITVNG